MLPKSLLCASQPPPSRLSTDPDGSVRLQSHAVPTSSPTSIETSLVPPNPHASSYLVGPQLPATAHAHGGSGVRPPEKSMAWIWMLLAAGSLPIPPSSPLGTAKG
ncbi:hypothetical protein GUJ93_ZPchr0006g42654 [Zizania palustris]|uniref:Uncharacterized protein n=1 Tax=Zizania palustris TaxID=103762 RepID=A0A8J5VSE5_ZIZPA|nr:hypothetical protein GUJ93_ZPchr0006g42654 [Zizania palustris]